MIRCLLAIFAVWVAGVVLVYVALSHMDLPDWED